MTVGPWPRTSTVVALLVVLVATPLGAQEADSALRRVTITAGFGNSHGWVGAQGEVYFSHERVSAFLGLGYTPDSENNASGVTVAAGVRGYTTGLRNRGFGEISIVQVGVETGTPVFPGTKRYYGPAVMAGYQYASLGGFTFMVAGGLGFILETPSDPTQNRTLFVFNLGLGYTWR